MIKLIILDADKTIWDHHNVTELRSPFKLVSKEIAEDVNGVKVKLNEKLIEFLELTSKKGIIVSLASWNEPENVFKLLSLFGIEKYFVFPIAEPHPNKHLMIQKIIRNLSEKGINISPNEILYIDDRDIHLSKIKEKVGNVKFLKFGVDVKNWQEVIDKIRKNT
ncbi:MAG: magnesium-dependent phosphatase-1 [Thermoproteota archaeon]|nr:magnesium-dependent phosphatase-1 [Candidatus Brockarchaeota archaeon]MBO3800849.1 magnesium-dependent phosphatase-1 [Candidatus Brockarchaeota archaeon]